MYITIYVEPIGKARPRFGISKQGKKYAYTAPKTAHAENLIRDKVMQFGEYFERDTPLAITAVFFRERPKSLKKSVILPISRPDCDNYEKLLLDSLEKFVYANDSQITTAIIKKRFGAPPRIELTIEEEKE